MRHRRSETTLQSGERPPLVILTALRRVRLRLAWLAAEHAAARGLLAGLALGCLALLVRWRLPWDLPPGLLLLAVVVPVTLLSALAGGLASLRRGASRGAAARAADRDLGLADRLSTALELSGDPARGPFGDACIHDASHAAARVEARKVGRRRWPRETRLLPAVAALAAVLLLAPGAAVDDAVDALVAALGSSGSAREEAAAEAPPPEPRRRELAVKEALRRDPTEGVLPQSSESLAMGAVFKDTKLSQVRPDANAFLGTSDERLKLLRQPGSLPDLRQQPGGGGYQLRLKRMQEAVGAMGNTGISKKQFAELTDRLKQMGRERGSKGGAFDKALRDGSAAFEAGDAESAMDSMHRALDALGDGDGEMGDGSLPPSSEGGDWPEHLAGDAGQQPGGESGGQETPEDGRASHGSEPGSGGGSQQRAGAGEAPEWAMRNDSFVEGLVSQGESEAYDSDVTGKGAKAPSRLPYMNVFQEYRKQVEDTLVKEAVPLEARERVRAYFRSLEE